jgi:hypothetical protein
MRLALANRSRRAKEEIEFTNVRIIILALFPLYLHCLLTKIYTPRKRGNRIHRCKNHHFSKKTLLGLFKKTAHLSIQ